MTEDSFTGETLARTPDLWQGLPGADSRMSLARNLRDRKGVEGNTNTYGATALASIPSRFNLK